MKRAALSAFATFSVAAIAGNTHVPAPDSSASFVGIHSGQSRSERALELSKQQRDIAPKQPEFVGDFDIANWTLINTPVDTGGSFMTDPGPPIELYLTGGDNQSGNSGNTDFQITIPADGTLTFDWGFDSTDSLCFDSGGYTVNGTYSQLACTDNLVPFFSQSATVPVSQGDTFAFRVYTDDGLFGNATLGVTNFEFLPLGSPEIAIDPTSLSFSAPQDQVDSATLDIANVGTGTLTWTVAVVADQGPTVCADALAAAWLSAEPSIGNTAGGSSTAVQVDADATGLAVGNYAATLCIDSNDGAGNEHLEVPVDFEVTLSDTIFANGFECASGLDGCPAGGTPGIYTDRDLFLANVAAGFYEEDFLSVAPGDGGPSMNFSGNGFAYTISAAQNLYNGDGFISTNNFADPLVITFTGAPVTAIGGNFWPTDIDFNPLGTDISITLSDGTVETLTSSGSTDFRGFVTKAPITSISIDASDDIQNAWATLDNIIVGSIAGE
jgi:hypothetical protein